MRAAVSRALSPGPGSCIECSYLMTLLLRLAKDLHAFNLLLLLKSGKLHSVIDFGDSLQRAEPQKPLPKGITNTSQQSTELVPHRLHAQSWPWRPRIVRWSEPSLTGDFHRAICTNVSPLICNVSVANICNLKYAFQLLGLPAQYHWLLSRSHVQLTLNLVHWDILVEMD